jgi:phosphatidylethanolamine-binding protein (PEBP) family uncharacterized protein
MVSSFIVPLLALSEQLPEEENGANCVRHMDLKAGASKKQVLDAMQGHILAQGRLTGIYQR